MTKTIQFVLFIICFNVFADTRFAVIGDFGQAGANERAVANLVKSLNPEFIVTVGDNNYETGSKATIDRNIGQYYSEYIYPYKGKYKKSPVQVNRFFPALGNHDWDFGPAAYLDYFTLPNNERYYSVDWKDVRLFVLNSNPSEPDGVKADSKQAQWLKQNLKAQSPQFQFVFFHHPGHCSTGEHGDSKYMQWPFNKMGLDAVFTGHEHFYEHLEVDGLNYFVNGLGGKSNYRIGRKNAYSKYSFDTGYGAQLVEIIGNTATVSFYSTDGKLRDKVAIRKP